MKCSATIPGSGLYGKAQEVEVASSIPTLKRGDYVLIDGNNVVERVLSAEYVDDWPGSASTLETDGRVIAVIK